MSYRAFHLGRVKTILARINSIYDITCQVDAGDIPAYGQAWETAYNDIFSDEGSVALYAEFRTLGWRLDYCDPDTSYEEDVRAYVVALREFCATKQSELETVAEVPSGSDLADLNWIEGPPTCEGEWLIQYDVPRIMSGRTYIVLVQVGVDRNVDDSGGLVITLPPDPSATNDPTPVPMFVAFPGNEPKPQRYRPVPRRPSKITHSCRLK